MAGSVPFASGADLPVDCLGNTPHPPEARLGKIVILPTPVRVIATRPLPALPAQILLFTGVRYERHVEIEQALPVRRQLS